MDFFEQARDDTGYIYYKSHRMTLEDAFLIKQQYILEATKEQKEEYGDDLTGVIAEGMLIFRGELIEIETYKKMLKG